MTLAPTSVQETLSLQLAPEPGPPGVSDVPAAVGADVIAVPDRLRAEMHRWTATFVQACVEVIAGERPVAQLLRWTTPTVYDELAHRAEVVARAGGHLPGHGPGQRPVLRPRVQNTRACFITRDSVEICARVRAGRRSRVLAGRVDRLDGRWQCTALAVG